MLKVNSTPQEESVNRAFSKQSVTYDADDTQNLILKDMRNQVYDHVSKFLKPKSHILELNAGTGIDALHFVQQGHRVHATDLSSGMVSHIEEKIKIHRLENSFSCQQLSYDQLHLIDENKFDFVFS